MTRKKVWGTLLALAFGALALVFHKLWPKEPLLSGQISLPALANPVEVGFDEFGVPRIEAQSKIDAYRVLGYVHARERLFQMELYRRIASGRLSEIFGEKLLLLDHQYRLLQFEKRAQKQWAQMDPNQPIYQEAMAYVEGINAFIEEGERPLEATLLGVDIKPWRAVDSLKILYYMGYSFGSGMRSDLLLYALSREVAKEWLDDIDYGPRASFHEEASLGPLKETFKRLNGLADLQDHFFTFAGSNAFLVGKARSASSFPLFANDTHIRHSSPPVWYEAQIKTPDFSMYGHYLAGVPFALLGQTPEDAYGITILPADTMDILLYEKIDSHHYRDQGKLTPFQVEKDTIKVRFGEDQPIEIRSTAKGVVVNELFPDLAPVDQAAVLTTTLVREDTNPLVSIYALGQARSKKEFLAAAAQSNAPALNLFYAHKEEGIVARGTGTLKNSEKSKGHYFPIPAADYRMIPLTTEEEPREESLDYILNANHLPETKPLLFGQYPYPARIERLKSLFATSKKFSVADLQAFQLDPYVPYAPPWVALLASWELEDEVAKKAKEHLKKWDFRADKEQVAPTIFFEWLATLLQTQLASHVSKPIAEAFTANPMALRSLNQWIQNPSSPWWDDPKTEERETRDQSLKKAFLLATSQLKSRLGEDPDQWQWAKDHEVTAQHPLGLIPLVGAVFDQGPSGASGGLESVNTFHFKLLPGKKKSRLGAATRRVIDFQNPQVAYGILPGGQSGVVTSEHFGDQWEMFLTGDYRKIRYDETQLKKLTVLPRSGG